MSAHHPGRNQHSLPPPHCAAPACQIHVPSGHIVLIRFRAVGILLLNLHHGYFKRREITLFVCERRTLCSTMGFETQTGTLKVCRSLPTRFKMAFSLAFRGTWLFRFSNTAVRADLALSLTPTRRMEHRVPCGWCFVISYSACSSTGSMGWRQLPLMRLRFKGGGQNT
jgi:hypothetical protein